MSRGASEVFYWLFTTGRQVSVPLLCMVTCSAICLPLIILWLRGVGIRRSVTSALQLHRLPLMLIVTFIVANLAALMLYTSLLSGVALQRGGGGVRPLSGAVAVLVGAPPGVNPYRLLIMGGGLCCLLVFLNAALWQGLRRGGWLYEQVDGWRRPAARRGAMGSAHFCTMREFRRYRRDDPDGVTLLGAFWGERGRRLDWGEGRFCLSAEDAARGMLVLGAPGSGKTQAVILPVLADRMGQGHRLIVVDPQGELAPHIAAIAQTTGHLVVIHDPTSVAGPRFNLAQRLTTIPAANAIARVLVPAVEGENKFWSDAAADLLMACLLRFGTLGDIKAALSDMRKLAETLGATHDDAALAAGSFIASVQADGKIATNVVATLGTALTGWSSEVVRRNTAASDFDANTLIDGNAVIVLTCPGAMRKVYAPYLGATLQKLMSDLDTLGEQRGGPLPTPVGVIIDEFPTLGKLDALVESVNLVRKRRLSILVAAQTKGQFHLIYGEEATKALFTGLATQIVYGGCDYDTAKFYSDASGTATADANPDPHKGNLRQRPLLTPDEIVNPQHGNCVIFSRFVEANFALQVILMAELTRLYERLDWGHRLAAVAHLEPFRLERGQPLTLTAPVVNSASLALPEALSQRPLPAPTQAELDAIFGTPAVPPVKTSTLDDLLQAVRRPAYEEDNSHEPTRYPQQTEASAPAQPADATDQRRRAERS